jgi:hypothetical protein
MSIEIAPVLSHYSHFPTPLSWLLLVRASYGVPWKLLAEIVGYAVWKDLRRFVLQGRKKIRLRVRHQLPDANLRFARGFAAGRIEAGWPMVRRPII